MRDILVGRDDGTVEVYGLDSSNEPTLRFEHVSSATISIDIVYGYRNSCVFSIIINLLSSKTDEWYRLVLYLTLMSYTFFLNVSETYPLAVCFMIVLKHSPGSMKRGSVYALNKSQPISTAGYL